MIGVRAMITLAAVLASGACGAVAQGAAPANTLVELQHQLGACMAGKSLGPAGSRLTIMLMMKRDGSIFGKPRITFSHLEGDKDARQQFIDDAERAVRDMPAVPDNAVARRRDRRATVLRHSGPAKG